MDDLISRQALTDFIKNASVWVSYTLGDWDKAKAAADESEFVESIIKQTKQAIISMIHHDIPAAQHEPSWDCEKCMMEHTDEMEKLEAELAIAKSKQPEQCEDAVSRQTLKDGFTEMCNLICPYSKKQQHVMCGSCLMGTAFDVLEATPSVTPNSGRGSGYT